MRLRGGGLLRRVVWVCIYREGGVTAKTSISIVNDPFVEVQETLLVPGGEASTPAAGAGRRVVEGI